MKASFHQFRWSALALFALAGCDTAPTPAPAPTPVPEPAAGEPVKDKNEIKALPVDKADMDKMDKMEVEKGSAVVASVDSEKLTDKEIANIKKLPANEQAIAMAQVECPVSGSHLGSMEMPIRQEVDGKVFFLCCDGCVDKVKEDPAAVLAKLKK